MYNPALSVELSVGSKQYADGRSSARRRCGVATIDINDIVTTIEAAELAGCCDGTIRKLCIDGKLLSKKHGREWLVSATAAKALYGTLPRSRGAAKKLEPVARRARRK
jgi:excisionase family DNA binding protein